MGKQSKSKVADPAGRAHPAADRRLIEEWLPIHEIGIESLRERTPMTPFPAPNRLHVWWARRPLVASRAAILASILPAGADRKQFLHMLGIHGDPIAARKRIEQATRDGERLGKEAYGYPRAFAYTPSAKDFAWFHGQAGNGRRTVLDPTAGGGSIPFEALRSGCAAVANDLNPVAWLILKATVEFPARFGWPLLDRVRELGAKFVQRMQEHLRPFFPQEAENCVPDGYLWARTVACPYCGGMVPLSPNWRLNSKGAGVRLLPQVADGQPRHCQFEIVQTLAEQSEGTVDGGDGKCPFPDCGRVIDGDEIKRQAQAGQMGEQLYAVVYREKQVVGYTAAGKEKIKMVRGFRAPRPEDDVSEQVRRALDERMPQWLARGMMPDEEILPGLKTTEPLRYGMPLWRDMFSDRQRLGHGFSVEVFHELVEECGGPGHVNELDAAALTYLAIAINKVLNWNSLLSSWNVKAERLRSVFDRHDYAFTWSFGEMAPAIAGLGYDWAVEQTGKALAELIELSGHPPRPERPRKGGKEDPALPLDHEQPGPDVPVTITCQSGDSLPDVKDGSVDVVVMDPPYYDNVMYAELADFFYVWLKRTAGLLFPEQFSAYLTDKDREAVANPAKFKDFSKVKGSGGAKRRAARDYQERMQAIFAECRRVLKPDGLMTLMFTHKATGAWDALAKGLVEAGFVITASWPISTEAEGSLHIKDKNAAKSTIFLVCRPRETPVAGAETTYWEDVEPKVKSVVLERVEEFEKVGMRGVDLYLSCFGPALQVFSEHWPMIRGRPAPKPPPVRGSQLKLIEEEEWDPYAVRPEDALMAARVAVKEWRLDRIAQVKRQTHLDSVTEFFVLAWDAFESPQFPADEALKLARVVGVNFDEQLRGHVLEVKGGDVILWDSATRAKKGAIGSVKGEVMLNALHLASKLGHEQNTGAAKDLIERAELSKDPTFLLSLDAMLNVLPTPTMVAGTSVSVMQGAAADAEALEKLRQLVFTKDIPQPKPWALFDAEAFKAKE